MDLNRKKQIIKQTSEACADMITNIRQLRISVLDLFTKLADNGPDLSKYHQLQQHQDNLLLNGDRSSMLYNQQIISNLTSSHQLCTSSLPPYNIQKKQEQQQQSDLIQYVQQMISSIATTVRNLDQDIILLMQNYPPPNQAISTGESTHLGMDGSLEKHGLYKELCESYKTFGKLHDYAASCHALLLQQSLKRVHKRYDNPGTSIAGSGGGASSSQGGLVGSRDHQHHRSTADSIVATFNPYNHKICLSRTSVLEACLKMCDFMEGTYSQPFGISTGVLQLTVNRVLKAILVMRGIMIDAVIVKAYHESFAMKASSKGAGGVIPAASLAGLDKPFVEADDDIDLWSESKYSVFRKLTHHANAAVLHFQYPTYPEIAVRSFLVSKYNHG